MIETLLSTLAVMAVPSITSNWAMPGGILGAMFLGYFVNLFLIIVVTVVFNVIRAWRYCDDSVGVVDGLKKGLLCGTVATVGSIVVTYIPALKLPFTIISLIPGLNSMVDGFVLSVFHLLSYLFIAYPIWGAC